MMLWCHGTKPIAVLQNWEILPKVTSHCMKFLHANHAKLSKHIITFTQFDFSIWWFPTDFCVLNTQFTIPCVFLKIPYFFCSFFFRLSFKDHPNNPNTSHGDPSEAGKSWKQSPRSWKWNVDIYWTASWTDAVPAVCGKYLAFFSWLEIPP